MRQINLGSGWKALAPYQGCDIHTKMIASALGLDAYESGIGIPAAADYIKDIRILRNPIGGGVLVAADKVPSAPIPQPSLSSWYILKEPGDPDELVGGRVLHTEWIDCDLPVLWKNACANLHGGACQNPMVKDISLVRPTWLVDVRNRCVVGTPYGCSYVALSYVWGNQKTLQASLSNHEQLQQPGSLGLVPWETPISKTILDAMGVAELLEEKYLWVDTLCIVQDDERNKESELTKMGAIYANASVTIMAVQGEHGNSGLRGLRGISEPRNLRQVVHLMTGGRKVTQSPVEATNYELACENTVWATRGWTFQEDFFSTRKLIFDGDSLRWECGAAIWRERVEWSSHHRWMHNDTSRNRCLFDSQVPNFNEFGTIIRSYNRREFTYPEDVLDAFAGVCFALGWSLAGGLVSGLPTASFDIFLLWKPEGSVLRRKCKVAEKYCLPSWSWVGWSGSVKMDIASASDFLRNWPKPDAWISSSARVTRLVSWKYHETREAPGVPIESNLLQCREHWLDGHAECHSGWTKHAISESPLPRNEMINPESSPQWFFRHPMHPGFEFWYPIPLPGSTKTVSVVHAPYISCSTLRAWLMPAERIPTISGDPPVLSLRCKKGTWAGSFEPHIGIGEPGELAEVQSQAVELVEIAKGSCRDTASPYPGLPEIHHPERPKCSEWYEYYWVIWVGWIGRVAHRKGLGRVCKQVWEAQRREEVNLMLE